MAELRKQSGEGVLGERRWAVNVDFRRWQSGTKK